MPESRQFLRSVDASIQASETYYTALAAAPHSHWRAAGNRASATGAARGTTLILALLAVLLLLRLLGMEMLPLMDTTEARYAEIGRKMAALGDWVTPWHDYGVPFWGKPPLSFWLTALSFRSLGVGEFAARLPHFLCALGIAWSAWQLAVQRSRWEALLTVALLAGSTLFFVSAGAVMTDGALVLGTTLAMLGFWRGVHGPQTPRQSGRWLLFIGIAIGLLAKGPLALVLIGTPLAGWTALRREPRAVWRAFPWATGIALVAALVLPWYIAAELRTPGFLQYFIVGEHWHRFMTPGWSGDLYGHAHRFPIGTVWVFAFAAALPWSALVPAAAAWRRWKGEPAMQRADQAWRLYLLLWALTPLLLFTVARNIIWTYALPALPALALLAGGWLARWPGPGARRFVCAGLMVSLAGVMVFDLQLFRSGAPEYKSAKHLMRDAAAQCPIGGPLIYLGARPHSAAFYSGGRMRRAPDLAQVPALLGANAGCVAARQQDAAAIGALPGITATPIARAGHEMLWLAAPRMAPAEKVASAPTDRAPLP